MPRSLKLELMDTGEFTQNEYETCLRQLNTINHFTMGYRPTLQAIARAATLTSERPLRIIDIGFGYGDTLREVAAWAAENKIAVDLQGIELNATATQIARRITPVELGIRFRTQDVFSVPSEETFHVVICALMTHHLQDDEIRAFMAWMTKHATIAWFINDLHRHWLPFWFIKVFARIAGFNRLIKNDAPLSVQRSFIREEWVRLIETSGLHLSRTTIAWWWSFRFGVFYRVI